MLLGQYPGLEWKTRRVGGESEKISIFSDHARAALSFLADNIAEDAALFVYIVLLRAFDLFGHINGKNGKRNELRMSVLERGAGGFSVIFENQDVFETTILLEVKDAVAEGPKHVFDTLGRKVGQAGVVVGSFDYDLMRTDAVHAVKHALSLAIEVALDTERGELVGNHPHRPARRVALEGRPAVGIGTVGLDLGGSFGLVAVTEGAGTAFDFDCFTSEIGRALGAIGRNNDPSAYDWVFSKFRQLLKSFPQNEANKDILSQEGNILEQFKLWPVRLVIIIHANNFEAPLARRWQVGRQQRDND